LNGSRRKAQPLPLKIVPVGVPVAEALAPAGGMTTVNGTFTPSPRYRVVTPAPLSDTHIGLVALAEMPQGLTRLKSRCWARPGILETRSVSRNESRVPALAPTEGNASPTAVATVSPAVNSLRACMPVPPCQSPFSGRKALFRLLRKGVRLGPLRSRFSPTSCRSLRLF